MKRIVIKEGPVVFLRNVFLMELLAAVFFICISTLTNYQLAYIRLGLVKFLRYDDFVMIAFSIFQLVYILALFFDWYFKYFEIREKEIVRRSGLLFRRQRSVSLMHVVAVEITQSPLDRMTKHATLILEHDNGRVTKIRNVAEFGEYASVIKQTIDNTAKRPTHNRSLQMLLKEGEGMFLEFKQTLRYDVRKKTVSKDVERAVMKAIAGFMNADGGTLVIGVDDEGIVTGLANDFETLAKRNRDGFENHLNMLVKTMMGIKFANYIHARFDYFNDKEACLVHVEPSHKPAYLQNPGGKEEFFVRMGNTTQPFSMSEAEEYIKTRWR
ncbi:MAG: putative DNA binding domain-containing protein [Patescibacteria group bacterium]|nr:putative DNA binding domain-containing protein [Patescibacteria group bacterium]MDE2172513.1 putative DNA binding domain-containing protein [Patescibacteria group bacterium]